jgi:hypothetical protein
MLEVWKTDALVKPVTCACGAVGLPDTATPGYPQVECNSCAVRFCAQCLIPWHKDLTCAEHASKHVDEQMSDPEKDTLVLMQGKDGKRCPNCFLVIEKDGGCDSMFCIGCHKYFNWATAGKLPLTWCCGHRVEELILWTASAVPGAKKAQPILHNDPFWMPNGDVVCEMDALQKKAPAPVAAAA